MKFHVKSAMALIGAVGIIMSFNSCQKEAQKNDPAETEAVTIREIDPIFVDPDSSDVYIPIHNNDLRIRNVAPPVKKGPANDSLSRKKKEENIEALARGNDAVWVEIRTKTGNSYSLFCYNGEPYGLSHPASFFLVKDGARTAYLGSTGAPDNYITPTVTLNCGSVYNIEVDLVRWDPVAGANEYLTIRSRDDIFAVSENVILGIGNEGAGGDIEIADINNNGYPDIFLMGNDNPSGVNSYRYRILMDVSPSGIPPTTSYQTHKQVTAGLNDVLGSGMDIGDINGNGIPDLLLMSYNDPSGLNSFVYKIGYDLDANGDAASWSPNITVTGVSDFANGAAVEIADIDKNGVPDLVLMALISTGTNLPMERRYRVAFNLNSSGVASYVSPGWYTISGSVTTNAQGLGLEIVDLEGDGRLWFFTSVNYFVGSQRMFSTTAFPVTVSGVRESTFGTDYGAFWPSPGWVSQGGGVAFTDLDGDGKRDMILMTCDNPSGANYFKYFIYYGLTVDTRKFYAERGSCI